MTRLVEEIADWLASLPGGHTIRERPEKTIHPPDGEIDEAGKKALALLTSLRDGTEPGADLAIGTTLGVGGTAVVRLALQAALGRNVAVKTLRPERRSDGATMALSLGSRNTALFPATLAFSAGGMVPDWSGPPGRVFFAHGKRDSVLPIATARDWLAPSLSATGFDVTFDTFDGGHELPEAVLEQAMVWWLGR